MLTVIIPWIQFIDVKLVYGTLTFYLDFCGRFFMNLSFKEMQGLRKYSFSQAFQKELGKRAGCIRTLKRSVRDLTRSSTADAHWLQEQMDELEGRWEAVCKLSVSKQDRLETALQQVVLQLNKNPKKS